MKSKKYFALIALGLLYQFLPNQLFAQTTANTTLNVVLADVRSIKVNPTQNTVTLNFATVDDYNKGVESNQASHLEITSTGGFVVKVKSSGPNLNNGSNTIPVNTISLVNSTTAGSSLVSTGPNANIVSFTIPVTLAPTPATLINSPVGATKIFYDVKYKASGGPAYINKPAGTYTTTITYSIEPL